MSSLFENIYTSQSEVAKCRKSFNDLIMTDEKDEKYKEEYPDASDTDIEIIRWALHDED
jgi:hypothetical protein